MSLDLIPPHLSDDEFMRVLTTYVFAADLAEGRHVLDAGCGTGHGTMLMAERGARSVLATDIDAASVEVARRLSARHRHVRCAIMDAQQLSVRDRRFDLVACFEVIEHVARPARLLAELRRAAVPGALTILSTPNRRVRLGRWERPFNPDHLREYHVGELRDLLRTSYPHVRILGIYGRGRLHDRYLAEWRPTLRRRIRTIARDALPRRTRDLIRRLLAARRARALAATGRHVAAPTPATWPFHVSDVSDDCLNFLAICGDDAAGVAEATDLLARSSS